MIQTAPYGPPEAAEIMSRYRPIAPKPPQNDDSALPKSPYLQSIYDYLQARPTRARRRTRPSALSPPYSRRNRSHRSSHGVNPPPPPPPPPYQFTDCPPAAVNFAFTGISNFPVNYVPGVADPQFGRGEFNFLQSSAVISPKPIRPVTSRVIITELISESSEIFEKAVETEEEVEAVLEGMAAAAMVSDSRNRVRMTNWAYKEMIGQPECGWLDCCGGGGRRIGGEVVMEFMEEVVRVPAAAAVRFRGKVEWESEGKKKMVQVYGSGVKLGNVRVRDYDFFWTFSLN